jgi:hypothetical protein
MLGKCICIHNGMDTLKRKRFLFVSKRFSRNPQYFAVSLKQFKI